MKYFVKPFQGKFNKSYSTSQLPEGYVSVFGKQINLFKNKEKRAPKYTEPFGNPEKYTKPQNPSTPVQDNEQLDLFKAEKNKFRTIPFLGKKRKFKRKIKGGKANNINLIKAINGIKNLVQNSSSFNLHKEGDVFIEDGKNYEVKRGESGAVRVHRTDEPRNVGIHRKTSSVFKLAEKVSEELKKRGVEQNFSESDTDYGQSAYATFYVNNEKYKVRISDHSVENRDRMGNEIHYHIAANPDHISIANNIERIQYPDRYKFTEAKDGRYFKEGKMGNYERVEAGAKDSKEKAGEIS